jgi:hypothetical protein
MMFMLALSVAIPRVINVSSSRPLARRCDRVARPRIRRGDETACVAAKADRGDPGGRCVSAAIARSRSRSVGRAGPRLPACHRDPCLRCERLTRRRALIPIPGSVGWTLLLSLIEAYVTWRESAGPRASRVAKLLSIPVTLVVSLIVCCSANRRSHCQGSCSACSSGRRRTSPRQGTWSIDSRPPHGRRGGTTADGVPTSRRSRSAFRATRPAVWMVVDPLGELLGFIGPRQLVRALAAIEQPVACRDAMARSRWHNCFRVMRPPPRCFRRSLATDLPSFDRPRAGVPRIK